MSGSLRKLLNQFRTLESVDLAALVAIDGLLIESTARAGVDADAICAVASNGLAMAEALGREANYGGNLQTILECEDGLIFLESITSDAMLVVMTNEPDQLGRLRYMIKAQRNEFIDALEAI